MEPKNRFFSLPTLPREVLDSILDRYMAFRQNATNPFHCYLTVRALCRRTFLLIHRESITFFEANHFHSGYVNRVYCETHEDYKFVSAKLYITGTWLALPNCLETPCLGLSEKQQARLLLRQDTKLRKLVRNRVFKDCLDLKTAKSVKKLMKMLKNTKATQVECVHLTSPLIGSKAVMFETCIKFTVRLI